MCYGASTNVIRALHSRSSMTVTGLLKKLITMGSTFALGGLVAGYALLGGHSIPVAISLALMAGAAEELNNAGHMKITDVKTVIAFNLLQVSP